MQRQAQGFTAVITNYDDDYEWSASLTPPIQGANVTLTAGNNDVTRNVVVTGLADGQSATVTVSTDTVIGAGTGQTDSASVTASSKEAAYNPTFDDPEPGAASFTVPIIAYEPGYEWTFSDPRVALVDSDPGNEVLAVTDLEVGEELTFTVTTTRDDYLDGGATGITGRSLQAERNPAFADVTTGVVDLAGRDAGGFEVELTNYNNTFGWVPTIDGYSNPGSGSGTAEITRHDNKDFLTVTGLADGQEATVTLSTTKTGFFPGSTTITGRALDAAYNPVLGTAVPGDGSFTVPITDYQAGYDWSFSDNRAVLDVENSPIVRVSGLDPEEAATIAFTTSLAGHRDGTGQLTGAADTGRALNPDFANVTPTGDGLTAEITNYNSAFTWTAVPTLGTAEVVQRDNKHLLVVSGVEADTDVSVTLNTSRAHYLPGTASTQARTLNPGLVPQFVNATSLARGFSVEISPYTSKYRWTAASSAGSATISDQGVVRVTGLSAGQTAVLTIRTSRNGYADGRASVDARSLRCGADSAVLSRDADRRRIHRPDHQLRRCLHLARNGCLGNRDHKRHGAGDGHRPGTWRRQQGHGHHRTCQLRGGFRLHHRTGPDDHRRGDGARNSEDQQDQGQEGRQGEDLLGRAGNRWTPDHQGHRNLQGRKLQAHCCRHRVSAAHQGASLRQEVLLHGSGQEHRR